MPRSTFDIDDLGLAFLATFETAVRRIFRDEAWDDIEPFVARAFTALELEREVGGWESTRDYLRATWIDRRAVA